MENLFLVKRVHTHMSVLDSTESLVFRVVLPVLERHNDKRGPLKTTHG